MSRQLRWMLAVMVGLALVASACGNSGDDDTGSDVDTGDDSADTGDDASDAADADTGDDSADTADDATDTADDAADAVADDAADPVDDGPDRDTFVSVEGVPGVDDDEISVTVIGTEANNPLGTCILDCYVTGIQAYFDWQNSLGGLFGRDLVIGHVLDDELGLNQVKALEVIADEDALAVFNATLVASGWADLHEAGIPNFTWSIHGPEADGRDSVYGYSGVNCVNCPGRSVPFQVSLVGATKVASLGFGISENSKVCAQINAEAVDLYGAELGFETVYLNDELDFGLANGIGPEVTQMIEAGVDFVASCMDLNAMKTLAQEFERQGYRDQVTMSHPNTYNHDFVAEVGSLFNGDFVGVGFAPYEYEGIPAVGTFLEWVEAHGGPIAEQTMIGWINAATLVEGLIANGPEISQQGVIDGSNSLTAFNAGGLIPPVDWTRQHVAPTPDDRTTTGYALECVALVEIRDGGFETMFEPDKPWMCWDNDDRTWSEPVPTAFAD